MKTRTHTSCAALAIVSLLCGFSERASAQITQSDLPHVDALIVKYRQPAAENASKGTEAVEAARLQAETDRLLQAVPLARQVGFTLELRRRTNFSAMVVGLGRVTSQYEAAALAKALQQSDLEIEYAVPDRPLALAYIPNDPDWSQQWWLGTDVGGVRAPGGYDIAVTRSLSDPDRPFVGIVDTGYRPHVDMAAPVDGLDLVNRTSSAMDTGDARAAGQCPLFPSAQAVPTWHGTKIQSVIASHVNNSIGGASVGGHAIGIWHARWWGPCGGTTSTYAEGINSAVQYRGPQGQRVRVLVLTAGGVDYPCDAPMRDSINSATANGVLVVASAGNGQTVGYHNEGIDVSRSAPANCPGVMAIAATDRYGARAVYSNYGSGIAVSAPGGDKESVLSNQMRMASYQSTANDFSATVSNTYAWDAGTSFSAPVAAAVAAMVFNQKPTLTAAEVRSVLTQTARPFPGVCTGCGAGIVDMEAAIRFVTRRPGTNPPNCQVNPRLCARTPGP
ncbi:S8 family serine peptidase [Paucibacter sp. DJ1R-11]|uniref:S8 family serine peptidase n=1 Tax=Paucibacter sp. DJ1R-11 TaxID=2893556 RepID=UPI0021E3EADF|nr:S8 family serine peptidase [Paucibacter sp. DJ1R-11]